MYLVIILGKIIFNEILFEIFFYVNEFIMFNLSEKILDIYFIKKGVNLKDVLKYIFIFELFKKRFLFMVIV